MLRTVRAFMQGFRECGEAWGLTFDDDPDAPLSRAYDHGRTWGERVTQRRA